MNKKTLHWMMVGASAVIGMLVCWLVAGQVADRMVLHDLNDTVHGQSQLSLATADNIAQIIASDLSMARAIPATLAETPVIQRVLAQAYRLPEKRAAQESERRARLLAVPALRRADAFLHDVRGFAGLDNMWLVDTNGLCVASSDAFERLSCVGVDLASRGYVKEALLGAYGQMYAVGRVSGENGVFLSAPVYSDGTLVGAIVAKIGLRRLRHWVAAPGSFVADENGVIVMANESRFEGYRLPGARITRMDAAQRLDSYRRSSFPVLDIAPLRARMARSAPWVPAALADQMVELQGAGPPSLYIMRNGINSGFSVHLLTPITLWQHLLDERINIRGLTFAALMGSLLLAATIAASYRREKRHHREARRLASELQASNAQLSAEARDDALTGALSRRYFLSLLQREIDAARSRGTPLCVAIADLDHFKQINDRFGHTIGDYALEHFVGRCRTVLRATDAIGRLGGEEFAILLPATSLAEGLAVAERIRETLRQERSPRLPDAVELRVSIGVTGLADDDTLERFISRADRALYNAKAAGRDRAAAFAAHVAVPPANAAVHR
jgi:diguanylate cyclase (GGDEF)-like protein